MTLSVPVRRRARAVALACAGFLVFAPMLSAAPAPRGATPRVDLRALATAKSFDRFIVKFRAGSEPARSASAVTAALDLAAGRTKAEIQRSYAARGGGALVQPWLLNRQRRLAVGADVFTSTQRLGRGQVRLLLAQLAADPDVEYVEIDQVLHAALVPNDPSYPSEWGLQDADAGIRADKAWDLSTGTGVVVAVIDTGYTSHSDLNGNLLAGYDFISDVSRANDGNGRDADAHDPGDWEPGSNSSWHGTHVSGTIAAVTNNGIGVAGAAFNAKILPVRVLGVGGGDGSDIADAIVWASGGTVAGVPANANPAEVLNLSIGGGGGCSATYQSAIDSAVSRGTTVVVAAGNENMDAGGGSLSTCANVIVAGAHSSNSARSSFSNYGSKVDISAPGSSILSTVNTGATAPGAEGYANYSGTSMATPHVASAAALVQAYRVARGLAPYTPAQLEAQLKATAYPMLLGCAGASGAGALDARSALDVADGAHQLLADGVALTNQTAAAGAGLRYAMVSTTKADGLTFSTSGGTGNSDLYVRFGALPTTSTFDCSSTAVGNVASCAIPSAQPGTYYVLLQGTAAYTGVSVTGAASGNRKPVPGFSIASSGLTANFTDTSTDSDGSISTHSWLFGDGGTSGAVSPSHAYGVAGAYTVQETTVDNAGARNCALQQVKVNPAPVALANGVAVPNLTGNVGAELPFTLAVPAGSSNLVFTTTGGTGDADLFVKFGSPPTQSDYDCISPSPTTEESCPIANVQGGTYYVMVNAFASISGVTLVGSYTAGSGNLPPTADFSFTTSNLTASFTDASTDSDGSIASRSWDFGDGSTSTLANPSHTYASAGTYTVQLTATDNGGLAGSTSKPVTVTAGAPGVTLSVDDAVLDEGNVGSSTMSFNVRLSAAAAGPVRYRIATADGSALAGSDYTAKTTSVVTIPAGTLSKAFTVTIKGDTVVEPDEAFSVNLSNVTGATLADGQASGTIRNDDSASVQAAVSIDDVSIAEGNSGTSVATFTVRLSKAASGSVSYDIATANGSATTTGGDYLASSLSGQVIPAGQLSKTFSVTINGDTTVEADENFVVNVFNVVGATVADGQAIGTIANDDAAAGQPALSIDDLTVVEGNSGTSQAVFTVHLSQAAAGNVTYNIATVNGTATAGSDYVASSLAGQVIPAGQLSKTFSVTINGDTVHETSERFRVNVSAVTGATVADSQAIATINNDD
jgi:serine protease